MFTSSRQDPGFQQSSGTKTWKRLVEAVDLRYVQHMVMIYGQQGSKHKSLAETEGADSYLHLSFTNT